jgi:haloacetate dehalogenase
VFDDFTTAHVPADGLDLFVRHGGRGPAVLLLHGHPRTSSTWYRVAPALVAHGFTVVCPDLPGYGRSGKPAPAADHTPHSKRAGARRLAALMRELGHDTFAVLGHDRGALYAFRLALDHPERVTRLVIADALPVSEHLDRADARFALAWWHWFFFAQPDIPERVITADPDAWYRGDPDRLGRENHDEFRAATRDPEVVRGMLEDYRAGLFVDADEERADHAAGLRVRAPLLVLWSLRDDLEDLWGDPRAIWRNWAADVTGFGLDSGHHIAEDAPDELAAAVADFIGAPAPAGAAADRRSARPGG